MWQGGDEIQNKQSAVAKGKGALAINAASYANVTVYQYVTYEGGKATTRETTDPSVCPYPGLETFQTSEAEFFAGRESDVCSLEAKLEEHDVCGVIAGSGAGKSSLVHAGLIPALATREMEAWDVFAFKPGQEPLRGLARSMSGVLAEADSRKGQYDEIDETVADLRETPGRLKRYIEDIISRRKDASDGKRHNVLIFIDQWEELYTRENEDDHDILVRELLDVAERGLAKVLLTMRIDFMEEMVSFSTDLFRRLTRHFVEPMDEIGLRSVIEHPAKVKGLGVPEALTSRLIADLRNGKDHGSLPYLQFVLRQLWEKRDRKTNSLTTEAYDGMKGLKGAIGAHADAAFGKLSAEEQQLAQRILPRLANVSETGATTSRRLPFADFDEPARQLLRKLAEPDRRLIVLSSATADVQEAEIVAEVAHEALLDDWKILASWIADRKEFFRHRNKLEADAKIWNENGRRHDFLVPRGKPLLDAKDVLATGKKGDLSEVLEGFIENSLKRMRFRRCFFSFSLFTVVVSMAGIAIYLASLNENLSASNEQLAAQTQIAVETQLIAEKNYISTLLEQAELAVSSQDFSLAQKNVDDAINSYSALPEDSSLSASIDLTRHRAENSIDEVIVPREIDGFQFHFFPSTGHLISVNRLTEAQLELSNGIVQSFDTQSTRRLEAHLVGSDDFFTIAENFEGSFGAATDEISGRTFVLTESSDQLFVLNSSPISIDVFRLSSVDGASIPEDLSYFEYSPAVNKLVLSNGLEFATIDPADFSIRVLSPEETKIIPYHLIREALSSANVLSSESARHLISYVRNVVEDKEGGRSRTLTPITERRNFHSIPNCSTALLSFENGNVVLFDIILNKIARAFSFRGIPHSSFLSHDCRLALIVDEEGYTELWDAELGKTILRLPDPVSFSAILGFSEANSFGMRLRIDDLPEEANWLDPPYSEGMSFDDSNLENYHETQSGHYQQVFSEAHTKLYSLLPRLDFRQRRLSEVESASFSEGLILTVEERANSVSLVVYTEDLQEFDSVLLEDHDGDVAFLRYDPSERTFVFLLNGDVYIFDRKIGNVARLDDPHKIDKIEFWSGTHSVLNANRIFNVLVDHKYLIREQDDRFIIFDLTSENPTSQISTVEFSHDLVFERGIFSGGYFWLISQEGQGGTALHRFGPNSLSIEHVASLPSDCGLTLTEIRGSVFVYQFSNDEFDCSIPGTTLIQRNAEDIELVHFDGFILDALTEREIFLFYDAVDKTNIEYRSGSHSCYFEVGSQPQISHFRPGRTAISSPAQERITGLEGFFSGAIDAFLHEERFLLSADGGFIFGTSYYTVERRETKDCSVEWRQSFIMDQGWVDKISHAVISLSDDEVYVLRSNSGQVSVLQASSGEILDSFDTFGDPRRVLIDPDQELFGFSDSYGSPHTIYIMPQGYSNVSANPN